MNKNILILVAVIIVFLAGGSYFWLQRTTMPVPPSGTTTPTSTQPATEIKNPTVSNATGNLVGSNFLEGVGLNWTREESAAEYVLFRSDSINGSFTEIGRIPADPNRSTNAADITPDATMKTLCYRVEARDRNNVLLREYKPVCVLRYEE